MQRKAIFFDRDDTLVRDTGYMHKLEDLKFFDDTFSTLIELQKRGYLLFIVTNQSGINRGFYSEADMHKFNQAMLKELEENGIEIQDLAFCPHAPEENCDCRKPKPKMLNDLCIKHNIDKSLSYMVGDKDSDVIAGENAGVTSIKVSKGLKSILEIIL